MCVKVLDGTQKYPAVFHSLYVLLSTIFFPMGPIYLFNLRVGDGWGWGGKVSLPLRSGTLSPRTAELYSRLSNKCYYSLFSIATSSLQDFSIKSSPCCHCFNCDATVSLRSVCIFCWMTANGNIGDQGQEPFVNVSVDRTRYWETKPGLSVCCYGSFSSLVLYIRHEKLKIFQQDKNK